ncbi:hypothetical protein [Flavobacterium sp.]|uniref:hypothetical protein n=1 Tax=Flavobacterium sp. TaxID=239 RepID=UPI0028BE5EA5|nr:hypothetical protein [Flavobacterium sp.]
MKKTMLLIALSLITVVGYGQKKKGGGKTAAGTSAKTENVSVELKGNKMIASVDNAGKKEELFSKTVDGSRKVSEAKVTKFKAQGTDLFYVSWKEVGSTKTDLKKEDATAIVSEIWDVNTKTQMIGNTQTTTHIVEKVFLDKLKNASETQERMRREGFEFTLLPTGDFILKDKKSETKYSYNATDKKYVAANAGKKKK